MKEHSEKYMGGLKHTATFHGKTRVISLPEEKKKAVKIDGDSYINETLSVATGLQYDEAVYLKRSWPVPKSASVTATNIRKGRIPGLFSGYIDRFQVKVVEDPDKPSENTCLIRERRGRKGNW